MPKCKNCGARLTKFDKDICPVCGTKNPLEGVSSETVEITQEIKDLKGQVGEYKPRYRQTSFFLSLGLGFFGVPLFYVKKPLEAIITILCSILFIGGLFCIFKFAAHLDLLPSILIAVGGGFIENIIMAFIFLYYPNLRDGNGEFLQ